MMKRFSVMSLLMLVLVVVVACAPAEETTITDNSSDDTANVPAVQNISPQDYMTNFVDADADHFLIDVRTLNEFNSGHIANATNLDINNMPSNFTSIPTDQPIVVYCRSGNRSATAARMLEDAGYTNIYDLGGTIQWTAAGLPLQ